MSPFGGNARDRQRIPREHRVLGVWYTGGSVSVEHEQPSSLSPSARPAAVEGAVTEAVMWVVVDMSPPAG